MARIENAGRRFQDWTNKNVFVKSFESADVALASYQDGGAAVAENEQCDVAHESPDPHGPSSTPITALQAAWNVTNAIQGMFIVGLPFAVKVGGWITVFALIFVSYVCYRTGLSLIDCLYEDGKKVRKSYREVAETACPGLGKFVLIAQLTELASTCILYLVLAGDLLQGCIPSVDKPAWMMLVSAVLLGTAFLDDIRIVSHLSLANAVSHLIINAIMVIYCLSQLTDWQISSVVIFPNIRLLPTMIGVVVFGYTSHIFLPALEASMQDPKEFKWMLSASHIAAAIFKALFGLIGFLTFAEFTQKEISNSLPNQYFKILINIVLVVKALLCYGADKSLREWAACLRIILLLWTLLVALSVPYLLELMGLVGNITGTMLSFIWPAYFHLKLKGDKLTEEERKFNKFVIGMGIAVMVLGVYYSSIELITAIRYKES
uniref:Amino acid transporter transmembrane domain-containing protein n=1 Tax=Panagrolaimus sp. JU765 TaxID=591449 RepID=A0AC34RP00_9BILA